MVDTAEGTGIKQSTENGYVHFILSGMVDRRRAEELKAQFLSLRLEQYKGIVFDFRDVSGIGSAGLGKLLLFYKQLSDARLTMEIRGASPEIRSLLHELRLDSLFTVS